MWPTSAGRPAATACVRQPSACSVGHVVLARAGERCGAKRDGVHVAPLAAGALSASARATSAGAARKPFMTVIYRLAYAEVKKAAQTTRARNSAGPRTSRDQLMTVRRTSTSQPQPVLLPQEE